MPEVRPENILLRVGGYTMRRHGVWAVAGSRRGPVEVPITFSRADASTCATYVDAGGLVQRAAAGVVRPDYEPYYNSGLVLPDGSPAFGPRLEGSRQNPLLQSEAFNVSWSTAGLTSITANADVAPDGTQTADRLVEDAVGGTEKCAFQTMSGMTADARHVLAVHAKAGTRSWLVLTIRDVNAGTNMVTGYFNLAAGVVGSVALTGAGSGGQVFIVKLPNGWYRCILVGACNNGDTTPVLTVGIASGDGNRVYTGDGASYISVWGADFRNNTPVPDSYTPTVTSAVTRAAESFTVPFNFGPMDLTVLARVARPVWADASGTIGLFPGAYRIGTAVSMLRVNAESTSRLIYSEINTGATNSLASAAIPAGASLALCSQYRLLTTGGRVKHDVGAGFGSEGSAATAFSAFGNQTLTVGSIGGGNELYGVLLDIIIARGLFSLNEMLAIP